MHTWIIATTTAVAGLAVGALIGIAATANLAMSVADAIARAAVRRATEAETPAANEPDFDPEEERLDLIAIRDLLTAATIVGGFNGGEDSNLRHAIWELRAATDRGRDRFEDLLDDLDDEGESDDAEPAKAAIDA